MQAPPAAHRNLPPARVLQEQRHLAHTRSQGLSKSLLALRSPALTPHAPFTCNSDVGRHIASGDWLLGPWSYPLAALGYALELLLGMHGDAGRGAGSIL